MRENQKRFYQPKEPANLTAEFYDPDAEANLLACALAEPDCFLADISPEDFHDLELGRIWEVGQDAFRRGKDATDTELLQMGLRERGHDVSLLRFTELLARDVKYGNGAEYANRVRDMAARRNVQGYLAAAHVALAQGNGNWRELAANALRHTPEVLTPPQPKAKRQTRWTAAELLAADFPEPQWAVPGLIPIGLTFLAGRPKVGKSWLALQIAIAVGTGGRVLDRNVKRGRVLYIAREDNGRRLQERAVKQGMPTDADITFDTSWSLLTQGGLDDLERAITDNGYTLVVIDTLGRLLGAADQSDLADMTEYVGRLQEIAMKHDIAILAIDHHRKPSAMMTDPIDDIVGSTAKSAVADAALGLTKEQGKRGATLKVTGRDVEWQDLALSWDAVTCCWQYEGTTEEVASQGNKERILEALRNHIEPMTATDIASAAGIGRTNVHPILNDLVNTGLLERLPKVGKDVRYRIKVLG